MTSNILSHDYFPAAIGGFLISLSFSTNLLYKGRKTSIANNLYEVTKLQNAFPKLIFLLGAIWVSTFLKVFYSAKLNLFEQPAQNIENLSIIGYIIAGFLLGLGNRLANGDETEHCYSGIPLLSQRSFTAVLFSLIASFGTATFNAHFGFTDSLSLGGAETSFFQKTIKNKLNDIDYSLFSNSVQLPLFYGISALVVLLFTQDTLFRRKTYDFEVSFLSGMLFGSGCVFGGLTNREKVLQGLSLNSNFDSSLMITIGTVVVCNFILWNLILNFYKKPVFAESFEMDRDDDKVDIKLILGSVLSGVAYGMSGFTAGPALVAFTVYFPRIAIYLFTFLCGQFLVDMLFDHKVRTDVKRIIEKKVE